MFEQIIPRYDLRLMSYADDCDATELYPYISPQQNGLAMVFGRKVYFRNEIRVARCKFRRKYE